ncbi:hypothetical protein M404DRAFT_34056 [Pisolithus tinctorius Marx 270]|uniref:Uncharacterized protein n=1 Tax=Pisolithus tinctorius Marx 270 TaxID=870435 RepID=A0A0C3IEP7_PISTI|nr:hypothetical protein M404DRAFT_34056 [Pisolithus tinctorius Marx 270]
MARSRSGRQLAIDLLDNCVSLAKPQEGWSRVLLDNWVPFSPKYCPATSQPVPFRADLKVFLANSGPGGLGPT